MHRREKSAIQRHRREIVDDLFLEEDLLAKMMREKLFTPGMIDDIKVTCPEYSKVYVKCQNGHSKIDKTKILITIGSLMKEQYF